MTALSTSPVVTTVHMKPGSINSDTAIAHYNALTVATSRCWKRKAAHMTNGRIAKVSGTDEMYGAMPAPNTAYITPDRRQTRRDPSAIFRGVHAGLARAAQPRIRGVTMMIPTVSPCHHVHQFHNNSGDSSECTKASGAAATVAAIVALAAAMATNPTTSSPLRNGEDVVGFVAI